MAPETQSIDATFLTSGLAFAFPLYGSFDHSKDCSGETLSVALRRSRLDVDDEEEHDEDEEDDLATTMRMRTRNMRTRKMTRMMNWTTMKMKMRVRRTMKMARMRTNST